MVRFILVIHLLGAMLVLGGMVASGVWMRMARTAADAKSRLVALGGIQASNRWTLYLGSVMVLASGLGLAVGGPVPWKLSANRWLLWSVLFFFVVLFLAIGAQSPIIRKMMMLAEKNDPYFSLKFSAAVGTWHLLLMLNLLLLVVILFYMVFKP